MKVITIGRLKGNDVIIENDDKVSRHHLQIVQLDDGSFHLIDFNSTNGTYVNGNRVQGEVVLDEGDFVRIGDTMLPWITYFDAGFVSQAQEGVDENAVVTKDRKAENAGQNIEKAPSDARPSGTNIFAILGLVFAFVASPIGLIFSILGLVLSKKFGGKQKGLASAGLIIALIGIIIWAIVIAMVWGGASMLSSYY